MNNIVTDAEELGEFGDISAEDSRLLLLSFYSSHYFVLFHFFFLCVWVAKQYSNNDGTPSLVLCTVTVHFGILV